MTSVSLSTNGFCGTIHRTSCFETHLTKFRSSSEALPNDGVVAVHIPSQDWPVSKSARIHIHSVPNGIDTHRCSVLPYRLGKFRPEWNLLINIQNDCAKLLQIRF